MMTGEYVNKYSLNLPFGTTNEIYPTKIEKHIVTFSNFS